MKKEAKKEMEERGIMKRDEAVAAREDDDFQVNTTQHFTTLF